MDANYSLCRKNKACINVVPIDYIIDASVFLSNQVEAAGKTVHLTDPSPHPIEEIYERNGCGTDREKAERRLPRLLAEKGLASIRLQRRLGVEAETLDYLTVGCDVRYDSCRSATARKRDTAVLIFLTSIPSMTAFYEKNKKNSDYHIKIG